MSSFESVDSLLLIKVRDKDNNTPLYIMVEADRCVSITASTLRGHPLVHKANIST
jgi:hypothetical protein